MALSDYYSILQVSPDATLEQIKQSYRRLVRLHHPDLNKQASDDRIKALNEAYEVLGDAIRRAAYDALLLQDRRNAVLRELLLQQQKSRPPEKKMTWTEGVAGFVRELKKEMRDD